MKTRLILVAIVGWFGCGGLRGSNEPLKLAANAELPYRRLDPAILPAVLPAFPGARTLEPLHASASVSNVGQAFYCTEREPSPAAESFKQELQNGGWRIDGDQPTALDGRIAFRVLKDRFAALAVAAPGTAKGCDASGQTMVGIAVIQYF